MRVAGIAWDGGRGLAVFACSVGGRFRKISNKVARFLRYGS